MRSLKSHIFLSNSSNVYAVSRNIEDPALAKMTPIMPNIIDCSVDQTSDQVQSISLRGYSQKIFFYAFTELKAHYYPMFSF